MVLDGDGHAGRFGSGKVRLHQLGEFFDLGLELRACQVTPPAATADHQLGAEFFGERHFLLQTERPEIVARDAAHANGALGDLVLAEHGGEGVVAHGLDLLALIAVHGGPDIDGVRAGFCHLRQDLLERQPTVHGGGQNVIEAKLRFRGGRHCGQGSCGGGGAEKLSAREGFHCVRILRPFSRKGTPKCIGSVSPGRRRISGEYWVTYARRI